MSFREQELFQHCINLVNLYTPAQVDCIINELQRIRTEQKHWIDLGMFENIQYRYHRVTKKLEKMHPMSTQWGVVAPAIENQFNIMMQEYSDIAVELAARLWANQRGV